MVSALANFSAAVLIFLSGPTALPRLIGPALMPIGSGAGAGAGSGVAAGGSSVLLQAANMINSDRLNAYKFFLLMGSDSPLEKERLLFRWNFQLLSRVDLVGILEDVLIRVENAPPLVGVPIFLLCDF